VLRALPQDRRNIFDAREDLAATRIIIGRGYRERFHQRGKGLLDIEIRIALPARVSVKLPAHARQRRADQTIIHLLRNRPVARGDFLPARFEPGQILSSLVDARTRPIADPTWTLHSIDIVAGER